jgi:hypothetical protein
MKRSEIRELLRGGVNALDPPPEFGSGQISDFNSLRSHTYPSVWQTVKAVDVDGLEFSAPLDKWDIELIIAQKDALDSTPETYEGIVDAADLIAQKLIYQYRNVISGYKLIAIDGINREPFIKKYADCLTGVKLTFTITANDTTNVC